MLAINAGFQSISSIYSGRPSMNFAGNLRFCKDIRALIVNNLVGNLIYSFDDLNKY